MEVDRAAVGTARIGAICQRKNSGQLSYWVGPEHRGRGHGTQGAAIATALAFTEAGLTRLDTWVEAQNAPSRKIVEHLGFRLIRDQSGDDSILHYRLAAADFRRRQEDPMLMIREDQLQAFRDEELTRLAQATVDAVAERHPKVIQRLTQEAAMKIALEAAARARNGYQLNGQYEIGAVIRLALCIGPYFDLWPKANHILTSNETPKRKFAALNEALGAEDWEAAAAYAPSRAVGS
jgi:hypothetical protein